MTERAKKSAAPKEPKSAAETVAIPPHLIVLFGGTGDLAGRKLLPSLCALMERRGFVDSIRVLGVATSPYDDESYRAWVGAALAQSGRGEEAISRLTELVGYQNITEGFEALAARVAEIDQKADLSGNRLLYLAIPPSVFDDIVAGLAEVGLDDSEGTVRVVVEKPFGTDLASARHLNELLHRSYSEESIYRIDHYLAKETVQNLLVFRFANPLFESAWNRDRIASVEITVAETLGLEGRAKYFEGAGILRDIVQNHLLQVLSLVAMEPPVRLTPQHIRDEKVKTLQAISPIDPSVTVRGRYEAGVIKGEKVPGYLEEAGIGEDSTTETYARITLEIDNWRWRGVPFTLTAGKRLAERRTQIAVEFREPPICLFDVDGVCPVHGNRLVITLQPNEGFDLLFDVKQPGENMALETKSLSFRYGDEFGELPDAYETLLVDALTGDQTLFVRSDEAEEAWRILQPILGLTDQPKPYAAGSWGP